MDWYYPILGGVLRGQAAQARIAHYWDTFVVAGRGVRCVSDQPWVTAAETCELVMALDAIGETEKALELFGWVQFLRDDDGGYWCGMNFPNADYSTGRRALHRRPPDVELRGRRARRARARRRRPDRGPVPGRGPARRACRARSCSRPASRSNASVPPTRPAAPTPPTDPPVLASNGTATLPVVLTPKRVGWVREGVEEGDDLVGPGADVGELVGDVELGLGQSSWSARRSRAGGRRRWSRRGSAWATAIACTVAFGGGRSATCPAARSGRDLRHRRA